MNKLKFVLPILLLTGLVLIGASCGGENGKNGENGDSSGQGNEPVEIAKRAHQALEKTAEELGWQYEPNEERRGYFVRGVQQDWYDLIKYERDPPPERIYSAPETIWLVFNIPPSDKAIEWYREEYCKSDGLYQYGSSETNYYHFIQETSMGQVCGRYEYFWLDTPDSERYEDISAKETYLIKENYYIHVDEHTLSSGYPPKDFSGVNYLQTFWKYFNK